MVATVNHAKGVLQGQQFLFRFPILRFEVITLPLQFFFVLSGLNHHRSVDLHARRLSHLYHVVRLGCFALTHTFWRCHGNVHNLVSRRESRIESRTTALLELFLQFLDVGYAIVQLGRDLAGLSFFVA